MSGITDFIARWEVSGASERANYQLFLSELAEVLGFEKPHPATGTPDLDTYTFERPVTFNNPNGSTSTGFIDLYKRGCFVLEAKQGSEKNEPTDPKQLTLLPKDAYFVTIKRLQDHDELFASLMSKKYRAMAYFGSEAKQPFDDLKAVRAKLIVSASSLIRHYPRNGGRRPTAWNRWEANIGWELEPDAVDEITAQVEALIADVDARYGRWLLRASS
jgi:hypothetical protein